MIQFLDDLTNSEYMTPRKYQHALQDLLTVSFLGSSCRSYFQFPTEIILAAQGCPLEFSHLFEVKARLAKLWSSQRECKASRAASCSSSIFDYSSHVKSMFPNKSLVYSMWNTWIHYGCQPLKNNQVFQYILGIIWKPKNLLLRIQNSSLWDSVSIR